MGKKKKASKDGASFTPVSNPVEEKAKRDKEDAEIDKYLASLGLVRKRIPKDGACLFRAISEHIYLTQERHMRVRNECVDFLREMEQVFLPFVCTDSERYSHYLFDMRKANAWGGHVELSALALLYEVNIEILSIADPKVDIAPQYPRTLRLFFSHGNHYDCIYTQQQFQIEEMCQSLVLELVAQAIQCTDPLPTAYRNIGMEVYKRGEKNQQARDRRYAENVGREDYTQLGGFYHKSDAPETEFTKVKSRKRKPAAQQQKSAHPIRVPVWSEEDRQLAMALAQSRAQEQREKLEQQRLLLLGSDSAFPMLPSSSATSSSSSSSSSTTAAPAKDQSPAADSEQAATTTPTSADAAPKPKASGWGQKNWKEVFTPVTAAPPPTTTPSPPTASLNSSPATSSPSLSSSTSLDQRSPPTISPSQPEISSSPSSSSSHFHPTDQSSSSPAASSLGSSSTSTQVDSTPSEPASETPAPPLSSPELRPRFVQGSTSLRQEAVYFEAINALSVSFGSERASPKPAIASEEATVRFVGHVQLISVAVNTALSTAQLPPPQPQPTPQPQQPPAHSGTRHPQQHHHHQQHHHTNGTSSLPSNAPEFTPSVGIHMHPGMLPHPSVPVVAMPPLKGPPPHAMEMPYAWPQPMDPTGTMYLVQPFYGQPPPYMYPPYYAYQPMYPAHSPPPLMHRGMPAPHVPPHAVPHPAAAPTYQAPSSHGSY